MVTARITDRNVRDFFEARPAISVRAFCKQYGIPYDGFKRFLGGKDKRYETLPLTRMQELIPGLFHYGFKLNTIEGVEAEKTEEEIFLEDNKQ